MKVVEDYPAERILLGLIGAPIKHSASPAMHEAAARSLGRHGFYHLIEVADADQRRLRAMLDGIRYLGFAGVNVTYPYKEAVVALLDEVAPDAAAINAVNTVVVRDNRLIGYNTDASGFARACLEVLGSVVGCTIALIGAGGVGKAIGFALAGCGIAELRIFDRDHAKAEALAQTLSARLNVRPCRTIEQAAGAADGLVNATPVGMLPNCEAPVPFEALRRDLWVADAVYFPLLTPLLRAARDRSAKIMTGRELAIYQAHDAFKLFTGMEPPLEAMRTAFNAVMAKRTT